jgi:hypothetical protein
VSAETRTLGAHGYTVAELPLKSWRKLFAVVSRYAGALAVATSTGGKSGGLEALAALTAGIDEESLVAVEELIASGSFVIADDKKIELGDAKKREAHFSGKYGEYMRWLAFGLEVNFRPLLSELAKASPPPSEAPTS